MIPPFKDLFLDQFIEADIRAWVESKEREAEQLDLITESEETIN